MGIKGNPYKVLTTGAPNPAPWVKSKGVVPGRVLIEDIMTRLHMMGLPTDCSMVDFYNAFMAEYFYVYHGAGPGGALIIAIADHPSRVPLEKRAEQVKRRRSNDDKYEAGFELSDYGIKRAGTETPVRVNPQVLVRSPGGRHKIYAYLMDRVITQSNQGELPEGFRIIFHLDESGAIEVRAGQPFRVLEGFDATTGEGDMLVEYWRTVVRTDDSFFKREFPDEVRFGVTVVRTTDTDNFLLMLLHLTRAGVRAYKPGELYWWRKYDECIDMVLVYEFLIGKGWNKWSLIAFCIAMGCDYFEKWWTTDCIGALKIGTWLAEAPSHHTMRDVTKRALATPVDVPTPSLVRAYLDYLVVKWYEEKLGSDMTDQMVMRRAPGMKGKRPTLITHQTLVQASAKRKGVTAEEIEERINWYVGYMCTIDGVYPHVA